MYARLCLVIANAILYFYSLYLYDVFLLADWMHSLY
jgi:hypothetical protein